MTIEAEYRFQKQPDINTCMSACLSSAIGCFVPPSSAPGINDIKPFYARFNDRKQPGFIFAENYINENFPGYINAEYIFRDITIAEQWDLVRDETSKGNLVLISYLIEAEGRNHIVVAISIDDTELIIHDPDPGAPDPRVILKEEYDSLPWDPYPLIIRQI